EIAELERGVAERDRPIVAHRCVRQHRVRILDLVEALPGPLVGDDHGARVLERLAAGDVIEMVGAVKQVLDRLARDLLDLVDVGHHGLRAAVADRIGRDHAGRRDDEHGLVVSVAEDVDVVGAVDLGGRERGLRGLLAVGHHTQAPRRQNSGCDDVGPSGHIGLPRGQSSMLASRPVASPGVPPRSRPLPTRMPSCSGDPTMDYNIVLGTAGWGVWHSPDAGKSWVRHRKPFPLNSRIQALAVVPGGPRGVMAAGDTGVFKSRDGGASWTRLGAAGDLPTVWSLAVDPADPQTLFAGTRPAAIYRSRDGGATWKRLDVALATECSIGTPFVTRVLVDPGD